MKVSYSLLAANHLDLMRDLDNKKSQFDSIHFDFIDENYCGGLGLSVITLEQLCNLSNFDINVHVLMNKPKDIISSCDDPQGRKTVLGLIPNKLYASSHLLETFSSKIKLESIDRVIQLFDNISCSI